LAEHHVEARHDDYGAVPEPFITDEQTTNVTRPQYENGLLETGIKAR